MAGLAAQTERAERSAVATVMTWRAAGAGDAAGASDRASMWAELLAAQCRKRAQLCAFDQFKAPGMVPPGSADASVCPCRPLQVAWLRPCPRIGCPFP